MSVDSVYLQCLDGELDKSWNEFIQALSKKVPIEGVLYQAFWTRFQLDNVKRFTEETVERVFEELNPHDRYKNHQAYMRQVFHKFEEYYKIDLKSERGKAQRLLKYLFNDYCQWKRDFVNLDISKLDEHRQPKSDLKLEQDISKESQIYELLKVLDCNDQESQFRNAIKSLQPTGGFFVRADEKCVQQWLLDRLSRSIPSIGCATIVPLDVTSSWRREFIAFQRNLATRLNLPEETPIDDIIGEICELCQTKPFIIAIYEVQKLHESTFVNLIEKFWQPLVSRTRTLPYAWKTTVVLLLAGKKLKDQCSGTISQFDPQFPDRIVELPPLESIGTDDVRVWFKEEQVRSLLQQQPREKQEAAMRYCCPGASDCPDEPYAILEDICEWFGLEEGIAEIEKYWKLEA